MKPPVGIVFISILLALGSLLSSTAFAMFRCAPPPSEVLTGYATGFLLVGVPGLAAAVGLLRLKRWARYVTLLLTVIVVVVGLFFILIGFAAEVREPGDDAANRIIMLWGLALAACGGLGIYYFNRAVIKQRFGYAAKLSGHDVVQASIAPAKGGMPSSIVVVSVLSLIALVAVAMFSLWRQAPSHPCGVRISRVPVKDPIVVLRLARPTAAALAQHDIASLLVR